MRFVDKHKQLIIRSITILYMLFIFILSSIPQPPQPFRNPYLPIIEHIIEFSILSILLSCSISPTYKYKNRREVFIMAFVITTLYGLSDEIHQSFVLGRTCSIEDFIFDMVGAFIGSLIQSNSDSIPFRIPPHI